MSEIMTTLEKFLSRSNQSKEIQKIILACATSSKEIYKNIRLVDTVKDKSQNSSGDNQSPLDISSDGLFIKHLTQTNLVKTIASEEQQDLIQITSSTQEYFVAYDPYDGGGVGDVNMTFGSIIGLWSKNPIGKEVGDGLIAGCYALHGPRCTFVISFGEAPTIFEYDQKQDVFIMLRENIKITPTTKHFSPGNVANAKNDPKYLNLLQHWISSGYKLLYAGALVTDINHILMKGQGIFIYPSDQKHPTGKLRLLYEGGPLGLLIEAASGKATTQSGQRLLDKKITHTHQRETFLLGSSQEVDQVIRIMSDSK